MKKSGRGWGVCRRSLRLWGLGAALDNPGQPHCFQLEKPRLREVQGPPNSLSLEIFVAEALCPQSLYQPGMACWRRRDVSGLMASYTH